jgi:hypothetical protein
MDKSDILGDEGVALVDEAREGHQDAIDERESFLSALRESEGADSIDTQVALVGDHSVSVSVTLNGAFIRRLSQVEERVDAVEQDGRLSDVNDAALDVAEILADVIVDEAYDKGTFIQVYESEGIEVLGNLLTKVFEGVKRERERRRGAADGFRATE